MSRRLWVFCVFAAVAAVVFIRLGFWQIGRLHERRARNAAIAAQQRDAPVDFLALPPDTGLAHYRAAMLVGRYDYEHELVLTGRTRHGSPGVELLTPVHLAGSDRAVLVDRGWVYSPDASTVDRARWREGDSARVAGYVELYPPDAGVTTSSFGPRIVRRASRSEIAAKIPYPVAPYYLVAMGDTSSAAHPARREALLLDEGPHRSYAIQWFCFAAIAVGGAAAVVFREREERRGTWKAID
ncbi:MAG: SURF1 family protein [Gemmatimonadales bacterium]